MLWYLAKDLYECVKLEGLCEHHSSLGICNMY
jgi:hypothetical protein